MFVTNWRDDGGVSIVVEGVFCLGRRLVGVSSGFVHDIDGHMYCIRANQTTFDGVFPRLCQIIPHKGTSDEAAAAAVDVGSRQGKTCVVVKDVPGFYVNRL